MQIAENERLARVVTELEKRGLVENELDYIEKSGYNRTYISELMNGKAGITKRFTKNMYLKFNIRQEYLLEGEMPMFANDKPVPLPSRKINDLPLNEIMQILENESSLNELTAIPRFKIWLENQILKGIVFFQKTGKLP